MKRPWIFLASLLLATLVALLLFSRNSGRSTQAGRGAKTIGDSHPVSQAAIDPRLTKSNEDRLLLGDISKVPFQELFSLLANRTPEEIARLAEQLQTLPHSSAADDRVAAFYKAWAALDPKAAFASAIALRDARFREEAISAVVRAADPTAAAALAHALNDLPSGVLAASRKDWILSSAIEKWSQLEPVAAAQFLDTIGAKGLALLSAFSSTTYNWAIQDPAAALAWAQNHGDSNGNLAMQGALNGWWQKDPRAAEAYVAAQAGMPGNEFMAPSFAGTLFRADPVRAKEWASQLPSVEARGSTNSSLAQAWALSDPAAATQWAASLPADERGNSIGAAARIWAKEDPKAAGEFLNSLGGSVRDEAVASFSAGIAYEDSARALTWAATIADPALRVKSEEGIATEWLKNDSNAAQSWIQNSSLPAEEKAHLLPAAPGP